MNVIETLTAAGADMSAIEHPDFSQDRWTWMEFVSEDLRKIWPALSTEARMAVYLTAQEALLRFPD